MPLLPTSAPSAALAGAEPMPIPMPAQPVARAVSARTENERRIDMEEPASQWMTTRSTHEPARLFRRLPLATSGLTHARVGARTSGADLARGAPRAQCLDALLDALGQFALALQGSQRVVCLLHGEIQPRQLLADVVDHGALPAQHLQVDVDVIEQVLDAVGAALHFVDHLAARLDGRDLAVGVDDGGEQSFDLGAQIGQFGVVLRDEPAVGLRARQPLL